MTRADTIRRANTIRKHLTKLQVLSSKVGFKKVSKELCQFFRGEGGGPIPEVYNREIPKCYILIKGAFSFLGDFVSTGCPDASWDWKEIVQKESLIFLKLGLRVITWGLEGVCCANEKTEGNSQLYVLLFFYFSLSSSFLCFGFKGQTSSTWGQK